MKQIPLAKSKALTQPEWQSMGNYILLVTYIRFTSNSSYPSCEFRWHVCPSGGYPSTSRSLACHDDWLAVGPAPSAHREPGGWQEQVGGSLPRHVAFGAGVSAAAPRHFDYLAESAMFLSKQTFPVDQLVNHGNPCKSTIYIFGESIG